VKDAREFDLPVSGVFFYVGLHPNTGAFKGLIETDAQGFVVTDEGMATSKPGIFAAGDIRAKTLRQICTAVGDGGTAAFSAQHYLENS
jgi:thioredoxin reductase (NADPH)